MWFMKVLLQNYFPCWTSSLRGARQVIVILGDVPWSNVFLFKFSWWRHQMETLSALLAICVGNSPVTGKFPAQRPVTRSYDVFFDLRLSKRLSKQSWGWWLETPSRPLWCHLNDHRECHWLTKRIFGLDSLNINLGYILSPLHSGKV